MTVTASGLHHLSPNTEYTVMATVHASWLHPRKVREITVIGDKKMVVRDDTIIGEPVRIYDVGVEYDLDSADTLASFHLSYRHGNITIPPVGGGGPLATECDHFINCVKKRDGPLTDGQAGLAIVRTLAATDDSLRQQSQTVSVAQTISVTDGRRGVR